MLQKHIPNSPLLSSPPLPSPPLSPLLVVHKYRGGLIHLNENKKILSQSKDLIINSPL